MSVIMFCPVDPVSGILIKDKIVTNSQEFAGFLDWLTRNAQKDLRAKAYRVIDGTEPSLVAKAALIDQVAGGYIKKIMVTANRGAAMALSDEASREDASYANEVVGVASGELKALKRAIQSEIFQSQMMGVGLPADGVDRLVAAFDGQNALMKDVALVLSNEIAHNKKITEKLLESSIRDYLEATARRADVKRKMPEIDKTVEEVLGIFAPLIRYMENDLLPKCRAEMLAHLEDYVRSGWFFQDIVEKSTHPGCKMGAWWGATHNSVEDLRTAFTKLEQGEKVEDQAIGSLFIQRVAELSLCVKTRAMRKEGAKYGEQADWEVEEVKKLSTSKLFTTTAGSAEIDSFWISPDSQRYFITCATSTSTLEEQDDQMARYRQAIEKARSDGVLGHLKIPNPAMSIDSRTLALCSAQSRIAKGPGRQAGESILNCFKKGTAAQERQLVNYLNSFPFVGMLVNSDRINPEDFPKYHIDLFGASENMWMTQMSKAYSVKGDISDAAKGVHALAGLLQGFSTILKQQPLMEIALTEGAGGLGDKPRVFLESLIITTDEVLKRLNDGLTDKTIKKMTKREKELIRKALGDAPSILMDNMDRIQARSRSYFGEIKSNIIIQLAELDRIGVPSTRASKKSSM